MTSCLSLQQDDQNGARAMTERMKSCKVLKALNPKDITPVLHKITQYKYRSMNRHKTNRKYLFRWNVEKQMSKYLHGTGYNYLQAENLSLNMVCVSRTVV